MMMMMVIECLGWEAGAAMLVVHSLIAQRYVGFGGVRVCVTECVCVGRAQTELASAWGL